MLHVCCYSKDGPFGTCCENGRVVLPDYKRPPQSLLRLICGRHKSKYLTQSRQFNNVFAYSKFKCWATTLPGAYSDMRIQGAAYVATSGICAENLDTANFVQVIE